MKAITQDWLKHAETDLYACKKMIDDRFLTNIVLFHVQQTVEKCFKAIIEEHSIKIQKTHSLIRLHKEIKDLVDFEIDRELMLLTDEVYIETRYPGESGMLPDGKALPGQTKELYDFANYIFQETKRLLSKN